jgi:hypothetical protein
MLSDFLLIRGSIKLFAEYVKVARTWVFPLLLTDPLVVCWLSSFPQVRLEACNLFEKVVVR